MFVETKQYYHLETICFKWTGRPMDKATTNWPTKMLQVKKNFQLFNLLHLKFTLPNCPILFIASNLIPSSSLLILSLRSSCTSLPWLVLPKHCAALFLTSECQSFHIKSDNLLVMSYRTCYIKGI